MSASNGSVILKVRLTPRGGANAITRLESEVLHVRTAAPPIDGAANRALIDLLSKSLGIPKSRLWIIKGETSRNKTLQIEGLSPTDLAARLNAVFEVDAG